MPNLTSVSVIGLLGKFNHEFDFPENNEFVILHGPNGIGKTKLLELTSAILSGNPLKVLTIPFESATFSFSDGSVLSVNRNTASQPPLPDELDAPSLQFEYNLTQPGSAPERWAIPLSLRDPEVRHLLRTYESSSRYHRIGDDMWHDHVTGERFTTYELLNRQGIASERFLDVARPSKDNKVSQFLRGLSVHFIETQRLLTDRRTRQESSRERSSVRSRVTELAEDLASQLSRALAQNSQRSQKLERDFPRRILVGYQNLEEATMEAIQEKYNAQNVLRQRLAEISLLDRTPDLPLPDWETDVFQRRVLWTYLTDSDEKLSTFLPILERTTLFRDIINTRFLFKELKVDGERGFRIVTEQGAEISPEMLSSGEQHELVLTYELLFQAQRGSLVLIDEPEISLHVGWQKAFLSDIARIAQVSSLRFIIATHSPQIVNKWWSRARALHPDPDLDNYEVPE